MDVVKRKVYEFTYLLTVGKRKLDILLKSMIFSLFAKQVKGFQPLILFRKKTTS